MYKKYINIGQHYFEIQSHSSHLINLFMEQFSGVNHVPEYYADMVLFIHGGYETPLANRDAGICLEESQSVIRQNGFVIDIKEHYTSAHLYAYNRKALITAFYILYSLFIVHCGWGIMIRCGYTVEGGNAHLLSGELENINCTSGSITDFETGAVSIEISSKGAKVYTSPTQTSGLVAAMPLGSIKIFRPSLRDGYKIPGKTYALLQLLDLVPCLPANEADLRVMIKLLERLVAAVPIYQCSVNNNGIVRKLIS
ncbi:hypothetical protein EWI07_00840 [Sporolactobacillus sp. THM7-4]|nr:hypothetical protein EWI07_00840 [Sporolactobacillus sp. THM7-4]